MDYATNLKFPYSFQGDSDLISAVKTIAVWEVFAPRPSGALPPPYPCVSSLQVKGERKVATAPHQPSGNPAGLKETVPLVVARPEDPYTPG